ncbi:snRNA-activating protein complex subunit 1a [Hoplias malabaricus]|uniref:snRNA-activating protein complex subunit 1a n=1 Tax=Hoplias malabaricus TaxID=27720 RepID=UPI003461FDE5
MTSAAAKSCEYFWIPFKSDCEELLGRFQQTESVRYEQFAAIWRDMGFSTVFYGMTTNQEKRAFTRLAFSTVYNYFFPPYNFQIRTGALYMLYGLYNTQLPLPKEKIWIALKDWVHMQTFVSDALSFRHLDVVYIYRKLESEKVFYYSAMPIQLTCEVKKQLLHKDINEEFQDIAAPLVELVSKNTLEEIAMVQTHYEQIKQGMPAASSISVTSVNLTAKLQEHLLEFQQWQENHTAKTNKDSDAKPNKCTESSSRADLLNSIKSKAYGHLSRPSKSWRHRQVDMDTSGSGTDHKTSEPLITRRKKPPSLRARTWKKLGTNGPELKTQHWLLSSKEDDKAGRRGPQKNRFKW